MGSKFVLAGQDDGQQASTGIQLAFRHLPGLPLARRPIPEQGRLAASHGQVDIRQQLGIQ